MSEVKKENKRFIILVALISCMMVISVFSAVISIATYKKIFKKEEVVDNVTKENDVVIAEVYTILDTTNISDAYIKNDDSALNETDKQTLEMAKAVLEEIITEEMTPFEKEKAVYEWMCRNIMVDDGSLTVIPTTNQDFACPNGVLKTKKAVCVGFATTFRLFMQMMEIPCMVVHNVDLYHSWDMVQLEGDWYMVDTYSDSGVGSFGNFNLNDAAFSNGDGQAWDTAFFPACQGVKYNPCYMNSEELKSIYKIPNYIKNKVKAGKSAFGVQLPLDISEHDLMIVQYMLDLVYSIVSENYNGEMTYKVYPADEFNLLAINVGYLQEDEPERDLTEEELEKIEKAIFNAFGDWYY